MQVIKMLLQTSWFWHVKLMRSGREFIGQKIKSFVCEQLSAGGTASLSPCCWTPVSSSDGEA